MKKLILISLFLAALGFSFSCKKEKDEEAPFVSFINPIENQQFVVGQSIPVKFTIKDDNSIEYAQVGLTDDNGTSLVSTITYHGLENGQTVDLSLPIDNSNLSSGSYYVTVRASDGDNQKNYFVKVSIQQKPLQRKAIYVVTKGAVAPSIYSLDSAFQVKFEKQLTGDFLGAMVQSTSKQLITCGSATGKLQALALSDWTSNWSENPVAGIYPCYRAFFSNKDYSFVGYNAGFIKAYNASGALVCNAACEAGVFYPSQLGISSSYLLSEQIAFTGSARKLVLYNFPSGNSVQELAFAGEIVALLPAPDGDFFVFYNQSGQAKISRYSRVSNSFSYTYPSAFASKITAAAALSESIFMIATSNGIYRYQYNPQNLVLFKASVQADVLKYDESNSQVIAAIGKQLSVYDLNSALEVETKILSDTLVDIELLYNR